MNASEAFSELRALLQRPPSHPLKDRIDAVINGFYEEASEDERERFRAEYLDHVRSEMEVWPIAARVSWLESYGTGELELAKVLGLEQHTPNTLEALLDNLPEGTLSRIEGLRFSVDMRKRFWDHFPKNLKLLEARIEDASGKIKHIQFDLPSRCHFEWVADACSRYGESLEALNIHSSDHFHADGIIECLDGLPALRELAIFHTFNSFTRPMRWLEAVTEHPLGARLESLSFNTTKDRFEEDHLTTPGLWPGLRRLRVLGLTREVALELLEKPALAHVEVWNLARTFDEHVSSAWLDLQTRYWTIKANKRSMAEFWGDEEIEISDDLYRDVHMIDDVLLDGSDTLVPSSNLRKLDVLPLSRSAFEALVEQGADAYPNLREVTFRAFDWSLTPADYRRVAESTLWEQLDAFEWTVPGIDGAGGFITPNTYAKLHEFAQDQTVDLALRQRAWRAVLARARWSSTYKEIAKGVNLKGRSKLKKDEIKERLEALMPKA